MLLYFLPSFRSCEGPVNRRLSGMASVAKRPKAPVCGTGDHGFESRRSPQLTNTQDLRHLYAPVAQWIEHWASDPGVAGSSPARRATTFSTPSGRSVRLPRTVAGNQRNSRGLFRFPGWADFPESLLTPESIMNKCKREIWLLGHRISRLGLVDAA